jgi:hypothetical protein
MKPTTKLFTDIAREHLRIATLETRHSDSLDFHNVSVWGVKNALAAAYEAGVNACEGIGTEALEQDVPLKMVTALQMASNYMADDLDETDETEMCVFNAIRSAIDAADATNPPPVPAEVQPVVAVTVRGGLIEDLEATIPVHVIVADWDVPDEDTGKKPTWSVHMLAGGLSGPKAQKLRRLIVND